MEITGVRVELADEKARRNNPRILGFAQILFDQSFVVNDIKVIQGDAGVRVCMPSRRRKVRCPHQGCCAKNPSGSCFCSRCGRRLPEDRNLGQRYYDVAHPTSPAFMARIEERVLGAYAAALQGAG